MSDQQKDQPYKKAQVPPASPETADKKDVKNKQDMEQTKPDTKQDGGGKKGGCC
jgi:hypothetical protein